MNRIESEYYNSVSTALYICGLCVADAKEGTRPTNQYIGRAGSQEFEEVVKEGIREQIENIKSMYAEFSKKDNLYPLIDVIAPENSTEADERTSADITLLFLRGGEECCVPVNIKLTGGSAADNTSGWQGLGSVLFGNNMSVKSKSKFYTEIRKRVINPDSTDYFFWVFHKTSQPAREAFEQSIVSSFLFAYHNCELRTNFAQPLPIQMKAKKSLTDLEAGQLADLPSMKKMSVDLVIWMMKATADYHMEQAEKSNSALGYLNSISLGA